MFERRLKHWFVALVALGLALVSTAVPERVSWGQEEPSGRVPALIEALGDPNASIRSQAAEALGQIGPDAAAAVPALSEALRDPEVEVRGRAAEALGHIGEPATVPALSEALRDPSVRYAAAKALSRMGPGGAAAVPALSEAVAGPEASVRGTRGAAAEALANIAVALQDAEVTSNVPELRKARDTLTTLVASDPSLEEHAGDVRRAVAYLEQLWWRKVIEGISGFVGTHPYLSAALAAYPLLAVTWLLLFWLRPLALLRINDGLKPYTFTLFAGKGNVKVPLPQLLLVGFFHHRPRVLDAWVEAHVTAVKERFEKKDTVRDRAVHVPLLVRVEQRDPADLAPGDLRPAFAGQLARVLIWGEGGAGKTHLACQIARWAMADDPAERLCRHRMLPLLSEQELDVAVPEGRDPLRVAIGCQLQELADEPEPIAADLLERLLRHRRVLVIVDHLSEMSAATRAKMHAPEFPINALIVTSRLEESLGGGAKTVITPLRIEGKQLSIFVEDYLKRVGKRDLFDYPEYFVAMARLSEMVGAREITALLAKLYTEQMIVAKEEGGKRDLPETIPDLMLGYLNELNRAIPDADRRDDRVVHRDAKALAWECLSETYGPGTARIEDARAALSGEDAEGRLRYLEERLRLLRTVPPAKDRVRFLLDPLAEYLAGLSRVETYGADEEAWRHFLAEADGKEGAPEAIKGFLLAVRDCCLARGKEAGVPGFVEGELADRAGLDPEALERMRLEQRIRRLIANLSLPDAEDRQVAAEALRQIGAPAAAAASPLVEVLQRDEHVHVRVTAAAALGEIGPGAAAAVPALIEALRVPDPDVRRQAASALGQIGEAAVTALSEALRDSNPDVRREAAWALRQIRPGAAAAVPVLIEALRDPEDDVRREAVAALGQSRPGAAAAAPALVKAALRDPNDMVRWQAACALGFGEAAVPALIEALRDPDPEVPGGAAQALVRVGHQATSELIRALRGSDPEVRGGAADALGGIGPGAAAAVLALIEALRDPDPEVRGGAARCLHWIEEPAVQPLSIAARHDPDASVRLRAARALGEIRPGNAVPALVEALHDPEEDVRKAAAEALRARGEQVQEVPRRQPG